MAGDLLRMQEVRYTRADVAACNEHLRNGGVRLGCPVCFLRSEYAMKELMRRNPAVVFEALGAVVGELLQHRTEEVLQ